MKTNQWLNNARIITWWLDFSDLGWPDSRLTAKWENRAKYFHEKGVNTVVLSGFHFRWDYHPFFDRISGILGEITSLCHQHDLKVVEHHSATRIHRVRNEEERRRIHQRCQPHVAFYPDDWRDATYKSEKLADWRQISVRDGEPVFLKQEPSHCLCPNHPGFQKAYLDYIKDLFSVLPIDALAVDDLRFFPDVYSCGCQHCRERLLDEEGLELPPPGGRSFWENHQNPDFLTWLRTRCRWQEDHFKNLREALPPEVLLWGFFSSCVSPDQSSTAFSPQLFTGYFDAICYQIPAGVRLAWDREEIATELAGFASLAHAHHKPLFSRCQVASPEDVGPWLHLLAEHHSRPWISRQLGKPDAVPEEQLIAGGFHFERSKKKTLPESIQAIAFSEAFRDSLEPDEAEAYVESYRTLASDLLARGSDVHLLFDGIWQSVSPEYWECLWLLDSRSLSEEQAKCIEQWQEKGLAVGIS